MTVMEARAYLSLRLQGVCDRLGNGQKVTWSGRDEAAVRALLRGSDGRRQT